MRWRITSTLLLALCTAAPQAGEAQRPERPRVGVAFGGGSARGFAHIGVIRWFEEHFIPIDFVAGTSMGGLVGGAYAAGMSPAELAALLQATDWDRMFGASSYSYRSMQRKEDMRDYPSRLQLHVRRAPTLPSALNNGQQVDLLLQRMVGQYGTLTSFDSLPTPFRTVALDLRTGSTIVLDHGPLARALRATMSLPGVFPPVELDTLVLVDGGAMNNLPADVVRQMGADVVIAVKVGPLVDTVAIDYSLIGIAQQTVSAMMRANTRRALASADIVITAAHEFGGMDWRSAAELIEDGYRAAESMKQQLLPLAVPEHEWRKLAARRAARRLTAWPVITRIEVTGAQARHADNIARRLERHIGRAVDLVALDRDFARLSGLDRYVTMAWRLEQRSGETILLVEAVPDRSAPPFLMTTLNARNRTRDDYLFQLAGRYLAYDVAGDDSELRVDLTLGSDRGLGVELRRPLGTSGLFAAAAAAAGNRRLSFIDDDVIAAQYLETHAFGQLDLGWSLSADAELRGGLRAGLYKADVSAGDPTLPEVSGVASELRLRAAYDGQDSPIVPTSGARVIGTARYVLAAPESSDTAASRSSDQVAQAELHGSKFWSWQQRRQRLFVAAQLATSFAGDPLPGDQFEAGHIMRLDAFTPGEQRGDHLAVLTIGYLRTLARLPDFLGGAVLAGAWLQNGSAFDEVDDASWHMQLGVGTIVETLVGPAALRFSFGSGANRLAFSIGRIFH